MIRWTLAVLAWAFWGAGLLLVVTDTAPVLGVILSGVGALNAMFAGVAFGAQIQRRAYADQAEVYTPRTSAQAVQETLRDMTGVDRCCQHLDPLCVRMGCPLDPEWTGDRR